MRFQLFMRSEDGDVLRKLRTPARVDGGRTSVSKRAGFEDVIFGGGARVEKRAAHSHGLYVADGDGGMQLHSTHPSRRAAMAEAQDIMDDGGGRAVSVRPLRPKDEEDAEEYALRKSPRVMDEEDGKRKSMSGDEQEAREFDLADTSRGGQVDPADEGEDGLGRAYSDEVYGRLGGLNMDNPEMSPIPRAGAGDAWEGDAREIVYRPTAFSRGADDGFIGGVAKPYRAVGPNIEPGKGEAYIAC